MRSLLTRLLSRSPREPLPAQRRPTFRARLERLEPRENPAGGGSPPLPPPYEWQNNLGDYNGSEAANWSDDIEPGSGAVILFSANYGPLGNTECNLPSGTFAGITADATYTSTISWTGSTALTFTGTADVAAATIELGTGTGLYLNGGNNTFGTATQQMVISGGSTVQGVNDNVGTNWLYAEMSIPLYVYGSSNFDQIENASTTLSTGISIAVGGYLSTATSGLSVYSIPASVRATGKDALVTSGSSTGYGIFDVYTATSCQAYLVNSGITDVEKGAALKVSGSGAASVGVNDTGDVEMDSNGSSIVLPAGNRVYVTNASGLSVTGQFEVFRDAATTGIVTATVTGDLYISGAGTGLTFTSDTGKDVLNVSGTLNIGVNTLVFEYANFNTVGTPYADEITGGTIALGGANSGSTFQVDAVGTVPNPFALTLISFTSGGTVGFANYTLSPGLFLDFSNFRTAKLSHS